MRHTVILNADDLGLTKGVNRAIFEAARAGSVTSASLMVGLPGWDDALGRIRTDDTGLSIGLHVNLTVGCPLTGARTLKGRDGLFFPLPELALRATLGRIDPEDVLRETMAQLEVLAVSGIDPTHLDGHRHVHLLRGIGPAVLEAARHAGVRHVRVPLEPFREMWTRPRMLIKQAVIRASGMAAGVNLRSLVHFRGISIMDARDFGEALCGLLSGLPDGVTEIVVHPGYMTQELPDLDPYVEGREREIEALTSPAVLDCLRHDSIRLIGFATI